MRITEIRSAGKPRLTFERDGRVNIVVPIKVLQRRAQKRIVSPSNDAASPVAPIQLTALQLALVRAHRWLGLLESGHATSLKDISESESVDPSFVSRLINLTTLAPDIIEAILDNTSPVRTLLEISIDPPIAWDLGVPLLKQDDDAPEAR